MFEKLKSLFVAPVYEDEDKTRTVKVLNIILVAIFWADVMAISGYYILFIIENPQQAASAEPVFTLVIGIIFALALWGLRILMYRDRARESSWLLSLVILLAVFATNYNFNGLRDNTVVGYTLVIAIPTLLLRERKAVVLFTAGTLIALLVLYIAETLGYITYEIRTVNQVDVIIYGSIFTVLGVMLAYSIQSLNEALDRAKASEREAAEANTQLQLLNTDLEDRVAARTQALVTSAEIGRDISTILNQDYLVREVTEKIRAAFNYYQVHLYLLDESGETLELASGSGHAGAELVARHHTVPVQQGLVGRAVRENSAILAPNVYDIEFWLPNPLLPDTRSEVTVPISLGNHVLGVLDIQQNVTNGLGQNDADLLLSISGQVAVALQNSRLLAEAQTRAGQEALLNQIGQQIQGTTSIEEAAQVAIREIGRATNAPQVRIRLGKEVAARSGDRYANDVQETRA